MAADLITLSDIRVLLGTDPTDTRDDAMITSLITAASTVIRNYTERDFGAEEITEERTYEYDGSGFLDIDDASDITSVTFSNPSGADIILSTDAWRPMPVRRDDAPVYTYVSIYSSPWTFGSPEMGFTWNLDVVAREGRYPSPGPLAVVDGTWGWPIIPEDVKLAAFWTIKDWKNTASSEDLTAEAIEGYSRAWNRSGPGAGPALAIPNKARDILAGYVRESV